MVLACLILDVLLLEHLLDLGPGGLCRHMVRAGLILLAGTTVLLMLAVLLYDQIVGDGVRLGIGVEEQAWVEGHAAETGVILAGRVVRMTGHLRQALVTKQEGCLPRGVVDLLSVLTLIAVEDAQAATADGAIHQDDMGIARQPFEDELQFVRVVDMVEVAHGEARPIGRLGCAVTSALKVDGHREGAHHGLFDDLGRLLAHGPVTLAVVAGMLTQHLVIARQSHQFSHRCQYAAVRLRTGE